MKSRFIYLFVASVCGVASWAERAAAQQPDMSGFIAPAPLTPFGSGGVSEIVAGDAYFAQPSNGRDLSYFAEFEAGLLKPRITSLRTSRDGEVTFLDQIHSAGYDITALGGVRLGYWMWSEGGLAVAYRGFTSTSSYTKHGQDPMALEPFFLGDFLQAALDANLGLSFVADKGTRQFHSRIDVQRVDVDYFTDKRTFMEDFNLAWNIGMRFTSLHVETDVHDSLLLTTHDNTATPPTSTTERLTLIQRATNETSAFGGHIGVTDSYTFRNSGLSLFGAVDGGVLSTDNTQRYSVGSTGSVEVPEISGKVTGPGWLLTLNTQAGLDYSIPLQHCLIRLKAGYQFEGLWFNASGRGASDHTIYRVIDVIDHGPFAQFALDF